MAQFTAARDCVLRLPTSTPGRSREFALRAGETLVTDDPVTAAALDSWTRGPSADVVLTAPLAQRPANPTHKVDEKPDRETPRDTTRTATPLDRTR